jgi:hypothetical protein
VIIYEPNCFIVGPNSLYFILWGTAGDLPKMRRNKKMEKKNKIKRECGLQQLISASAI